MILTQIPIPAWPGFQAKIFQIQTHTEITLALPNAPKIQITNTLNTNQKKWYMAVSVDLKEASSQLWHQDKDEKFND